MEIQLEIAAVFVMPPLIDSVVVLRKAGEWEKKLFLINTDRDAALAITEGVGKKLWQQPVAHDLLKNCIEKLGGHIQKVVIGEFKDGISHASIYLDCGNDRTESINSRPVDALALAVRTHCPIYMEERVFEEGKMELPAEEKMGWQQSGLAEKMEKMGPEELLEFLKDIDPSKIPQA